MGKLSGKPGPDPGQRNAGQFVAKPLTIARLGEPKSHPTPSNPGRNARMQSVDGSRPCDCGKPHPRCRGHRANTNYTEPCGLVPVNGTGLCRKHGGRAPQAMAAAKRRNDKLDGIRGLVKMGHKVDMGTQVDALMALFKMSAEIVDKLTADVLELDSWVVEETDRLGAHKLAVNPTVTLWGEERDRLTHMGIQLTKIGIDVKRLQLEEAQNAQIVDLLKRVLTRAGLDPNAVEVRSWVREELDAIEAA